MSIVLFFVILTLLGQAKVYAVTVSNLGILNVSVMFFSLLSVVSVASFAYKFATAAPLLWPVIIKFTFL